VEWDWEPRTWGGSVSGLSILQASPTIPLKSSSLKQHWCSGFFFPCKDKKITGWIHGHCQDSVSVFPFQSQKTSLCTSNSEEHVYPYMLLVFHHITSHPIPFSSSSSAASSGLFLLMRDFQNSWYYMLKIPMKIRYRKVPGSVISLVLSNVLITEAFSYPFTIIFTYLIVYAFVFLFVCLFCFYLALLNCLSTWMHFTLQLL